jgi:serine/threonine protein kinase
LLEKLFSSLNPIGSKIQYQVNIDLNQAYRVEIVRPDGNTSETNRSTQKTVTLVVEYPGIFIPGFKLFSLKDNFEIKELLASGGFGDVHMANIVNEDIRFTYNNGVKECAVKRPIKVIPKDLFLQELSMHELFGRAKYFAKLICFSEEPQALILKYYKYGSLRNFIFPSANEEIKIDYSLKLILSISMKIIWAVNSMHEKGVIHNDIKPDNILLDGDDEEPLFPVISDFGIVKIMNTADLITGFNTAEIRACTAVYAAPELLASMKLKINRISNPKTDTYSVGIVLYELFSRHSVRKIFNQTKILNGELPMLSFEKIMAQWKDFNISNKILTILMDCVDSDADHRSPLDVVYALLCELDDLVKKLNN